MSERPCPNCGHLASGEFCSACGQRMDVDPKSLGARLAEVFDDTLSLSGRLPKTFWTLSARRAWDRFLAEYGSISDVEDEYGRHAAQIESMAEEAEPSHAGPAGQAR